MENLSSEKEQKNAAREDQRESQCQLFNREDKRSATTGRPDKRLDCLWSGILKNGQRFSLCNYPMWKVILVFCFGFLAVEPALQRQETAQREEVQKSKGKGNAVVAHCDRGANHPGVPDASRRGRAFYRGAFL